MVVITGAGRGIGRATALEAARRGGAVALLARTRADVEAVAGEIGAASGRALAVPGDVSVGAQVAGAVKRTLDAFGRIDVVVNNAGVGYWEPVETMAEERWDHLMAVNVKSGFLMTREVLPLMRRQGGGQLIFVSSLLAREPRVNYAAYSASKAALLAFARGVAVEVKGTGIRVTSVCPGLVDTTFSDIPHGRPRADHPPAEKMLTPDDVAQQIVHVMTTSPNALVHELWLNPTWL